jgi:hypothetical protein
MMKTAHNFPRLESFFESNILNTRQTLEVETMNGEHGQTSQACTEAENRTVELRKMSRREALAIVGKHAVYTAPAVLAVLSLTKSGSANASGCPTPSTCTPG